MFVPVYHHGDRVGRVDLTPESLKEIGGNHQWVVGVNSSLQPVIITQKDYYQTLPTYDSQVDRVVIIDDPHFPELTVDQQLNHIYQELTSPLGHPPIYGLVSPFGFQVIDHRKTGEGSLDEIAPLCQDLSYHYLQELIQELGGSSDHVNCRYLQELIVQREHLL